MKRWKKDFDFFFSVGIFVFCFFVLALVLAFSYKSGRNAISLQELTWIILTIICALLGLLLAFSNGSNSIRTEENEKENENDNIEK